jgi:hypothetical protein
MLRGGRGFILAALLASSTAFGQTQEAVARTRFNKGRDLFMSGQYIPALVELRAAAELYESPNTRLYIARCERELGHNATAYVEFQRTATEAADRAKTDPRYAGTQDAAKQEAAALQNKLAHVTIVAPDLPDDATITLNGAELGAAGVGVAAPVDPGAVDVVAKAPGYVTLHKTANAAAGETIEVKLKLVKAASESATSDEKPSSDTPSEETPAAEAKPGHGVRNAGFVVGGLGIATLGVFATFAAMAQSRFDSLKSQCNGPCDPSFAGQISDGQTYQTVANVTLVAGSTLVVAGAIMIIVGVTTGKPAPVQAAFTPLPGGGWMGGIGRAF